MTTLTNPLGTKTFWVNVYEAGLGNFRFFHPSRAQYWGDEAIYRLKVRPWIPHDGGLCPVEPHVRVRVRTRDGWIDPSFVSAGFWTQSSENACDWWAHECASEYHIIAYQIMEDLAPCNRAG